MRDLTVAIAAGDIDARIVFWLDNKIEMESFCFNRKDKTFTCTLHLVNGHTIDGVATTRLCAKKRAIDRAVLIAEYLLAEAFYKSAESDNSTKGVRNEKRNKGY